MEAIDLETRMVLDGNVGRSSLGLPRPHSISCSRVWFMTMMDEYTPESLQIVSVRLANDCLEHDGLVVANNQPLYSCRGDVCND